jgi:glycosyltransferase involved in cell wall biosynthesis
MSRGLAVVASDTSGMKDYITHGKTGLLFLPGNTAELCTAASRLLGNQNLTMSLGLAAMTVASTYTWKSCAERAVEFYRDLLSLKSKTANGQS